MKNRREITRIKASRFDTLLAIAVMSVVVIMSVIIGIVIFGGML